MQPCRHLLALAPAVGNNQHGDPLKMINIGAASFIDLALMQATRQPCRARHVHAQDSTAHGLPRDTADQQPASHRFQPEANRRYPV
jgi:hypothetical protein